MKAKLTKTVVDKAQPTECDQFIWDSEQPGFVLKITPKGRKVFFVEGRVGKGRGAKMRRITIGTFGKFTVEQARTKADDLLRELASGRDPVAEAKSVQEDAARQAVEDDRKRARRFATVLEDYLARRVRKQAKGRAVESLLRTVFEAKWAERDVATITRADVRDIVDSIVADGRHGAARETLKRISPFFAFCMGKDYLALNPATGVRLDEKYVPRDRVLTEGELAEVWRAAETESYPFGPMVKLLILTGQRLREVAEAKWAEIDLEHSTWTIPAERSKNRKPHIVHLSPQAMTVLDTLPRMEMKDEAGNSKPSPFLFTTTGKTPVSGFSKAKASMDKAIAEARVKAAKDTPPDTMPEWTYHDLRRSFATGGARIGITMHVVERVLNHVPAAVKGVARVYQHHEFLPERQAAMEAWGRHVEASVNGTGAASNIVPLRA